MLSSDPSKKSIALVASSSNHRDAGEIGGGGLNFEERLRHASRIFFRVADLSIELTYRSSPSSTSFQFHHARACNAHGDDDILVLFFAPAAKSRRARCELDP